MSDDTTPNTEAQGEELKKLLGELGEILDGPESASQMREAQIRVLQIAGVLEDENAIIPDDVVAPLPQEMRKVLLMTFLQITQQILTS